MPLEGQDIWTPQLYDQNRGLAAAALGEEVEMAITAETAETEVGTEAPLYTNPGLSKVAWEAPKSGRPLSAFLLAFAVWCDRIDLSRADYSAFYEVVKLSYDNRESWKELPKKLDTLQHIYQSHLPAPPIYERDIDLCLDKQPTGQSGAGKVYYFDQIHLTETILRSKELTKHMHFGMAELVDQPSELWYGEAWAESIRTCSGQFALYPDGQTLCFTSVLGHVD